MEHVLPPLGVGFLGGIVVSLFCMLDSVGAKGWGGLFEWMLGNCIVLNLLRVVFGHPYALELGTAWVMIMTTTTFMLWLFIGPPRWWSFLRDLMSH